ncbi:MAG: hypothetical protein AAF225_14655, partial [Pseudomonadota bacterium]
MRYLPLTDTDRAQMLRTIGVSHIDELFADVPVDALNPSLNLPNQKGEFEVDLAILQRLAASGSPSVLLHNYKSSSRSLVVARRMPHSGPE